MLLLCHSLFLRLVSLMVCFLGYAAISVPRAHCASALFACAGWTEWERNTGCLNRCYQGCKFQTGSNGPAWIFIFIKGAPCMLDTTHTQHAWKGKNSNTGCVMTALLNYRYSRKSSAAAAGEGDIGLATQRSFDLLLLPLHFTIHQTVPACRIHTELHVGSYVERHTAVKRDCAHSCKLRPEELLDWVKKMLDWLLLEYLGCIARTRFKIRFALGGQPCTFKYFRDVLLLIALVTLCYGRFLIGQK